MLYQTKLKCYDEKIKRQSYIGKFHVVTVAVDQKDGMTETVHREQSATK